MLEYAQVAEEEVQLEQSESTVSLTHAIAFFDIYNGAIAGNFGIVPAEIAPSGATALLQAAASSEGFTFLVSLHSHNKALVQVAVLIEEFLHLGAGRVVSAGLSTDGNGQKDDEQRSGETAHGDCKEQF